MTRTGQMQRRIRRRGMTLIECSIASAILAVAASAVATALAASYQQQAHAQRQAHAAVVAQRLAAEIAALPYDPADLHAARREASRVAAAPRGDGLAASAEVEPLANSGGAAALTVEVATGRGRVETAARLLLPTADGAGGR